MNAPNSRTSERALARKHVATLLRIAGWLGLWAQLGLGMGAAFVLVLAREREIQNHPGTEFGLFLVFTSLIVLLAGTVAKGFNIYAGRLLRQPNRHRWPSRQQMIHLCDFETILHWSGTVLVLAGAISILTVLTSVAMTLVPGIINDPSRTIQPLDLIVLQGCLVLISAHLVGITTSLLTLRNLVLPLEKGRHSVAHRLSSDRPLEQRSIPSPSYDDVEISPQLDEDDYS